MRISVYLVLFITGAVYVQGQTSKSDSVTDGRWELVWHDEFDGDGAVDSTYWNYELGFVRNEEYQWYRRENVVKRDGILFIEGLRTLFPTHITMRRSTTGGIAVSTPPAHRAVSTPAVNSASNMANLRFEREYPVL